jgi:hypothetical protein
MLLCALCHRTFHQWSSHYFKLSEQDNNTSRYKNINNVATRASCFLTTNISIYTCCFTKYRADYVSDTNIQIR